jgi:hypothetical protein
MYVQTAGMGRRGMGDVMGPMFTCSTGEQVFKTSDCPGGQPAPDVQQQIADVWSSINTTGETPVSQVAQVTSGSFTTWLNANATTVGIGAAVVVGLFLFMGRR